MARITLLLWVVTGARLGWAQTPEPPVQLMARAKERMQIVMGSQPNYTCLETIDRTRKTPDLSASIEDTLRLEVALVDGSEMFAWPGSKEFQTKELRELMITGLFGNGNFGMYTNMLFAGDGPAFEPDGETKIRGRRAIRFRYRVPRPVSGYYLTVGQLSDRAGFHGFVFIDPETADALRVELVAEEIPPHLGVAAAESTVDFARVRISPDDEPFLLPIESTLMLALDDATRGMNRTRFSACRKFVGESALILEDPALLQSAAGVIEEVRLAVGAEVELEFKSSIPLRTIAIGDEITAELKADLKEGKRIVVPKGAIAKGRIWALQRVPDSIEVLLRIHELSWPGAHATFRAEIARVVGFIPRDYGKALMHENMLRLETRESPNLKGSRWVFKTVP
jgi:hypothetical protein